MTERELKLKEAAQLYYTDGKSPMTDEMYDAEMVILMREQPDSELLSKTGWGYSTQLDSTPGERFKHRYGVIGSLRKAHNWAECKLLNPTEVSVSAKLDGLTCVAYIQDGVIVQGLTNADENNMGVDITKKLHHILRFNQIKDKSFSGAVRGELVMSYANFKEFYALHADDKTPPKNPRNSTVGLINGKEITEDYRFIQFIPYTVVGIESRVPELEGCTDPIGCWLYQFLSANFDEIVSHQRLVIGKDTVDAKLQSLRDEWSQKFPIDGIVVTPRTGMSFNSTIHEVMYDAFAYKFPAESKESEVIKVEWNMSKTRYAIPLVYVNSVQLSGTTVSKATGFNMKYIKDNQIGPGAIVKICKSGEIIPYILEVIEPSSELDIPSSCPDCGQVFSEIGVHLQCTNTSCIGAAEQDLIIWLEFLSPIDSFGTTLKLKYLEIVFKRIPTIEDVMSADYTGFRITDKGSVQWNLFCDMLDKLTVEPIELVNALQALNIPRLGEKTTKRFAEHPDLVKDCIHYAQIRDNAIGDEFDEEYSSFCSRLKTHIGDANSKAVLDNLNKFARLLYISDRIIWDQLTQQVEFKGKVAITGTLSVKRSVFEAELKAAGFEVGDLKKGSLCLITDNPDGVSTKNKNADLWGVQKLSEQEFRVKYM